MIIQNNGTQVLQPIIGGIPYEILPGAQVVIPSTAENDCLTGALRDPNYSDLGIVTLDVTSAPPDPIRSGVVAIANGATSLAVVFSAPLASANYAPQVTLVNLADPTPTAQATVITALGTTGFTAKWATAMPTANYQLAYVAAINV